MKTKLLGVFALAMATSLFSNNSFAYTNIEKDYQATVFVGVGSASYDASIISNGNIYYDPKSDKSGRAFEAGFRIATPYLYNSTRAIGVGFGVMFEVNKANTTSDHLEYALSKYSSAKHSSTDINTVPLLTFVAGSSYSSLKFKADIGFGIGFGSGTTDYYNDSQEKISTHKVNGDGLVFTNYFGIDYNNFEVGARYIAGAANNYFGAVLGYNF